MVSPISPESLVSGRRIFSSEVLTPAPPAVILANEETAMSVKVRDPRIDYPTSDGRPMAETDIHRDLMIDSIQSLEDHYSDDANVYVSGNLLVFYVRGDRRRHLSPDVFVVRGVPKRKRDNYLIWEEGRGPEFVLENTSKSTREEDVDDKFVLYQDELRVPEYFLFDPRD